MLIGYVRVSTGERLYDDTRSGAFIGTSDALVE
jgi:hypothetical protein